MAGVPFYGGPVGGAGMALSALAQFGIYCEMKRMNLLKEAQFEERRHGWIDDISRQWIEEHSGNEGIISDVTEAVAVECRKMWRSVCENEKVDVPQAILLRLSRMADFLDYNYDLVARASNEVVRASKSAKGWNLDTTETSNAIVRALVEAEAAENQRIRGKWWSGPLKLVGGVPLFFIPAVGGFAAGGAWGAGLVETVTFLRTANLDFERIEDKIPLLRFELAVERVLGASAQLRHLLEGQRFKASHRLGAVETGEGFIAFILTDQEGNFVQELSSARLRRVKLRVESAE